MSLIISPHTCAMSTMTRQTSSAHSAHSSPGPKQLTSRKHVLEHAAGQGKQDTTSNHNASVAECATQKLIDPFLAQYIRPESSLDHKLYFTTLNKSFNYYEKYLNQNQDQLFTRRSLREAHAIHRLSASSLRQDPYPTKQDEKPKSDVLDQLVLQRRRKSESDLKVQPDLKKPQPKLIAEILPAQFNECRTADLINLMSRMIQSLISLNDRSVPESISGPPSLNLPKAEVDHSKKLLTRYHSRTPPAISIHTYITRLAKFNNLTPAILLTTIYYIDLLSHNFQPYFTLNSWTVHRFLLVGTMLAQKSMEDFFFTNDHYARVGGVALTELNFLELDFLYRVDWKLVPAKQVLPTQTSIRHSKEVLDLYYWQLVNLMGKNTTDQDGKTYMLAHEVKV